ncbi:GNAT family N-acetyltransferase [Actinoplanes sp. NPDC051411]|uniref:GNAT family N-acetyltransferase n=1 Tax=Actinoplanes sp. NPDC051411 TaxID=3155522 RepID=UPI00342B1914
MKSWTVRRVTVADAARMRALRLEMLADSPLAFLETLAQAAARPHEAYRARITQSARGRQVAQFIADTGGRLIGHAGGTVMPDDPATTVVFAVYLTPAYRGGKVLAELIDAVAAWSRECGRDELMLEVVTGNDRAVRAYEKLGFEEVGEPVPHPVIPVLTELRMRRRI